MVGLLAAPMGVTEEEKSPLQSSWQLQHGAEQTSCFITLRQGGGFPARTLHWTPEDFEK